MTTPTTDLDTPAELDTITPDGEDFHHIGCTDCFPPPWKAGQWLTAICGFSCPVPPYPPGPWCKKCLEQNAVGVCQNGHPGDYGVRQ